VKIGSLRIDWIEVGADLFGDALLVLLVFVMAWLIQFAFGLSWTDSFLLLLIAVQIKRSA
jgi:hypothetical protein